MNLTNHTRFPAGIARMVIGQDDRIAASVLVRVTFDLRGDALVPSESQPWIVSQGPWEGPKGPMDGDLIFYKGGVDVFVFGHAVAEGGRPASELDVEVRVGSAFQRSVRVFGPRVWYRRIGDLVPTPPGRFEALALTLRHAYGGRDTWDGLEIPWPENPDGMGFYATREGAIDKPLPYIEEPSLLIAKWDDRPPAAGLGPLPIGSAVRSRQGLAVDKDGTPKVTPRFFNAAFAPMICPSAKPGDRAAVAGVSPDGLLAFTLPEIPFFVRLRFGAEQHELPLAIDQIGIEADERRVFIAYRCPFRYIVVPLQARECHLLERT
ncbi:MAG: DUF2169 domain-containing protein [Polyangiaceae bacterium]|nr:DUF2169 domain-containing protein [Polyangiaceae bacterium]